MAKKSKKTKSTKKPATLSGIATNELAAELARRERQRSGLERKRDRLLDQLAAIDAELSSMGPGGGGARRGGGKRARNEMTLQDALARVLKGKVMGVSEVAEAVQAAGYKTTSPNFRTIVNQTLLKNKKLFKKQGRGQYTAA